MCGDALLLLCDPNHASPAVSGGRIFLKGRRSLFCVGTK